MIHQSDQQPIRKYDIWLADLPAVPESHVQSGVRPVIVVSNDIANAFSWFCLSFNNGARNSASSSASNDRSTISLRNLAVCFRVFP